MSSYEDSIISDLVRVFIAIDNLSTKVEMAKYVINPISIKNKKRKM